MSKIVLYVVNGESYVVLNRRMEELGYDRLAGERMFSLLHGETHVCWTKCQCDKTSFERRVTYGKEGGDADEDVEEIIKLDIPCVVCIAW
jgi:hypothetical protein